MIIDGKKQAEIIRNEIKKEISDLKKKSGKTPSLTVILIGDFAPSLIYVKNKDCLLYTSPSPRDNGRSRMPSSA